MRSDHVEIVFGVILAGRIVRGNDLVHAIVMAPSDGLTIRVGELDRAAMGAVGGDGFVDRLGRTGIGQVQDRLALGPGRAELGLQVGRIPIREGVTLDAAIVIGLGRAGGIIARAGALRSAGARSLGATGARSARSSRSGAISGTGIFINGLVFFRHRESPCFRQHSFGQHFHLRKRRLFRFRFRTPIR